MLTETGYHRAWRDMLPGNADAIGITKLGVIPSLQNFTGK